MPDEQVSSPGQPAPPPGLTSTPPPPGSAERTHRSFMADELRSAMRPLAQEPAVEQPPTEAETQPPAEQEQQQASDTQPPAEETTSPDAPAEEQQAQEGDAADASTESVDEAPAEMPWNDDGTEREAAPATEEQEAEQATDLTEEQDSQAREAFKRYMLAEHPDPDQVLKHMLATSRGKRMYDAFKTVRSIQEAPSADGRSGGLGYVPSVDDMRDWRTSHNALNQLYDDFEANDAQKTHQILSHFFGPTGDGNLRPGAARFVGQLPGMLASQAETRELYGHLADPIISNFRAALVQRYEGAPSDQWKDFYKNAISAIDVITKGEEEARRIAEQGFTSTSRVNGHAGSHQQDPATSRQLSEKDQRIQELEQKLGQASTEQEQAYDQAFHRDCDTVIDQAVDAVIGKMKTQFSEKAYNAIRRDVGQEVLNIANDDPIFRQDVSNLLARSFRATSEAEKKQFRDEALRRYRQKVGSVATGSAQEIRAALRNSSTQQKQESDERRARLASGQEKTDASSTGTPVGVQTTTTEGPRDGQSHVDWMTQELARP